MHLRPELNAFVLVTESEAGGAAGLILTQDKTNIFQRPFLLMKNVCIYLCIAIIDAD